MATQLFDPYGRIIEKPPAKPSTEMIGTVRIRDQFTTYPSVGLTPQRLATILKEADAGDVLRQAELFEEMEEKDIMLGSLLHTRRLAVQGIKPEILPFSDSAEDKKIADAFRENWNDLDHDEPLLHLLDAIGKGFGAVEINWQNKPGATWIEGFEWIPQKRFTFVEFSAAWDAPLPKVPRLLTDKEPLRGEDIPLFKIVYHRYGARSGFPQRGGILRGAALLYLLKNFDLKDWIIFIEKFGQPMRLGKFTPGASEDDKNVLKQAIRDLGSDAGAMISDTTMLDILEAKTTQSSNDTYDRFLDRMDKYYQIGILGQTATTEGTPGKLGSSPEQAQVRSDLKKADARALEKTLRWQIAWPWVGYNFGFDKKVPYIKFSIEDPDDLQALATTHKTLVEMGTPIPLSFIRDKYGIPEAKDGEEVLTPPAQPAANPFGQPGGLAAIMLKKKVPGILI